MWNTEAICETQSTSQKMLLYTSHRAQYFTGFWKFDKIFCEISFISSGIKAYIISELQDPDYQGGVNVSCIYFKVSLQFRITENDNNINEI